MLYLPENMLFTRSFSMSVVITVCLDIINVALLFFLSIIAMNDREKRLIVVNYAPNKPLIMRKRIGGLKDRLKARSRFFRSRKEGLWPFLRPWGKSKEAVLLQSSLQPDPFNDLDWVIARYLILNIIKIFI